jgi:methyl-accepting chemotaxis protein
MAMLEQGVHQECLRLANAIVESASRVNRASSGRLELVDELVVGSAEIRAGIAGAADGTQEIVTNVEQIVSALSSSAERIDILVARLNEFEQRFHDAQRVSDTIASIAKQTNMLALNAMIEAARVEGGGVVDGAGFMVVANEVKALANNAAQAAQSIMATLTELTYSVGVITADCQGINADIVESSKSGVDSLDKIMDLQQELGANVEHTLTQSGNVTQQMNSFSDMIGKLQDLRNDTEQAIQGSARNNAMASQIVALMTKEA